MSQLQASSESQINKVLRYGWILRSLNNEDQGALGEGARVLVYTPF